MDTAAGLLAMYCCRACQGASSASVRFGRSLASSWITRVVCSGVSLIVTANKRFSMSPGRCARVVVVRSPVGPGRSIVRARRPSGVDSTVSYLRYPSDSSDSSGYSPSEFTPPPFDEDEHLVSEVFLAIEDHLRRHAGLVDVGVVRDVFKHGLGGEVLATTRWALQAEGHRLIEDATRDGEIAQVGGRAFTDQPAAFERVIQFPEDVGFLSEWLAFRQRIRGERVPLLGFVVSPRLGGPQCLSEPTS